MGEIQSSVNALRQPLEQLIPLDTPFVLYVEPSGYCNFKCTFCPHYLDPDSLTKDTMSLATFEKIISDISSFQSPLTVLRLIGTGEPLLNKNIVEFARLARNSSGIKAVELTTNASLLKPQLALSLSPYLDRIIVSVEGLDDSSYLKYSGMKVRFSDIVHNVRRLYEVRSGCQVYVKIHGDAVSSERDAALFYETFLPISDKAFIENLVDLWPETPTDYRSSQKARFGGQLTAKTVCSQIFKSMMINANGDIVPCCVDYQRKLILGNVLQASLSQIWHSQQLNLLRRNHLLGKKSCIAPCSECSYNDGSDVDNIDAFASEILPRILIDCLHE